MAFATPTAIRSQRLQTHDNVRPFRACWPSPLAGANFLPIMNRYALFVDAGSLLSFAAKPVAGDSQRRLIAIEPEPFIGALIEWANATIGFPLLRTYWYDGEHHLNVKEHARIARMNDVKLRLGRMVQGSQKGVDSLLYGDILELIEHKAIDTALLIASDGDFTDAVERCQRRGLRVELALIDTKASGVSRELFAAADAVHELPFEKLRPHIRKRQQASTTPSPNLSSGAPIQPQTPAQPTGGLSSSAASTSPPANLVPPAGSESSSFAGSTGPKKLKKDPNPWADTSLSPTEENKRLPELIAEAETLGSKARNVLDAEAAILVMQGAPHLPKNHYGELMYRCAEMLQARLSIPLSKQVTTAWMKAFKATHETLKKPGE